MQKEKNGKYLHALITMAPGQGTRDLYVNSEASFHICSNIALFSCKETKNEIETVRFVNGSKMKATYSGKLRHFLLKNLDKFKVLLREELHMLKAGANFHSVAHTERKLYTKFRY